MRTVRFRRMLGVQQIMFSSLLAVVLPFSTCNQKPKADVEAQNQTAMWLNDVPELKSLNVSNAEVAELSKAHGSGMSDASCVALIKLARSRGIPFAEGQLAGDLVSTGSADETVLELARLNQLKTWAGQAAALRLVGFSDRVILAVAKRRSQGLSVLSGEKLGELKNSGASDAAILDLVEKGITEQQASAYIAQRERAAGGHGFVYQGHRKRR